MINALRDDTIVNKFGGRFKFTALVQHRVRELMEGARPLIDRGGKSDIEVAIQEIVEGKIDIEIQESAAAADEVDGEDEEL